MMALYLVHIVKAHIGYRAEITLIDWRGRVFILKPLRWLFRKSHWSARCYVKDYCYGCGRRAGFLEIFVNVTDLPT